MTNSQKMTNGHKMSSRQSVSGKGEGEQGRRGAEEKHPFLSGYPFSIRLRPIRFYPFVRVESVFRL